MYRTRGLWLRWVAGLAAIILLIGAAAWLASRFRGEKSIHFWMDDATGIEPGTVVNLSGVRAGAVTRMSLDADPSRQDAPRAKIRVGLTTEAFKLLNPRDWVVAITTSPLPGFKAEVDIVRNEGEPLPELADGAWHTDTRSAITKQINLAFDALMHKVRDLTGGEPGEAFSLKSLFPRPGGEGGDATLMGWVFNPEQLGLVTSVLKNVDSLTGTTVESLKDGGLAQAALGTAGHANLMKLTEDLGQTVGRLRSNMEERGDLLRVLLTEEDSRRISDVLKNVDSLADAVAKSQQAGGLAQAALGTAGHANLLKLTEDLGHTVSSLRIDVEDRGNLIKLLLTREDSERISGVLKNVDALAAAAAKSQEAGGLAHAALGSAGHANLMKLTEDLGQTVSRLRGQMEGQGNLLQVLLTPDDARKISDVLNNIDMLAGSAVESQKIGGLAHTALGSAGHANLVRLTEDAANIARRVRVDLEDDGTLLQLLFTKEDSDKISDLLGNLDLLSQRVRALDLTRLQDGMDSIGNVRAALDDVSGMITRLIGQRPDGRPSELEEELAELPQHIKKVYDSVDKASMSTDQIMEQTSEVLRKATLTVSSINQLLMSLKRSWLFRGAFNESLRYEDLAPFLVPSGGGQGGERFEHEDLLKSLDGDE